MTDNKDDNGPAGRLTSEQYRVTQEKGTEPAFTGGYLDMKDDDSPQESKPA